MKKFLLTCYALVFALVSFAQERTITGRVTSTEDGTPLPGVNVVVKGTTTGTSTDAEGYYSLTAPNGAALTFSFIGLESKEVQVGERTVVDISLALDITQLSEVVVVGYGTQRREDVIGNIVQVKGEAIASIPVQSFDAALGGRAAGVQVTIPNGVLNNPPVFRIRGTNSINLSSYPLIVIDGVPTFTGDQSATLAASNALASINPSDIESMEILKDASATAIYGSRAANGVVIITTKRGNKGKAKVNYDGWVGFTSPYREWKMLNAEEYTMIKNEGLTNVGAAPRYFLTEGPDGKNIDTDWSDVIFRTGTSSSHAVNIQGGTDATTYFFSTGYTTQEGIIVGNDFERLSARFNVDHKANDWLSLGLSTNYSNELNEAIVNSGSLDGGSFASGGVGRLALSLPPNVAPRNNDGTYNLNGNAIGRMNNLENITFWNPQPVIDKNYSNTENNRVQANAYAQISPVNGLTIRTIYGIDYLNSDNENFYTSLQGDGYSAGGSTFATYRKLRRNVWTTTAQYSKVLADRHSFDALLGTEQQRTTVEGFGLSRLGLSDEFFADIQGGWTTNNTAGLQLGENYLWSGFGRLNYNFDKKYFVGASFRRDGYSAFATGLKYGTFYSVSAGWDIAKEGFWTNNLGDVVNSFRLRGSYGTVGNIEGINDFASNSFYGAGYYNGESTLVFTQAGNPDLTWETSKKVDIGFTFGLMNDRISGEVAWYKNNIDGLLLNVPQTPSTGMPNNPLANVGSMFNQGIELTLNATPIDNGKLTWNTSINFSTNRNEVTQLAPGVDFITSATSGLETASITQPGLPVGYLWVVRSAGVNPENGRRIFINANGEQVQYDHSAAPGARYTYLDGSLAPSIISGVDNVPYTNSNPKYFGGFDNTVRYGNFELNVLLTYMGGFSVYNGTRATVLDQRFWNSTTAILNRWQNPGDQTNIPRLVYADNTSNGSAFPISENVQKGDFLKVRNVMLSYRLPSSLTSRVGLASARVYVSGANLAVLTGYEGPDPEVSSNGNANLRQGIDRNTVPNGRTLTMGINLGF